MVDESGSEGFGWIEAIAERKIVEAMDEGAFDNLPGAGKPLDLTENPFEPPGLGAVNRLLKNNNVLPPWLLLEKEIETSKSEALAVLARWEASVDSLMGDREFPRHRQDARAAYERHMRLTNDLILKYNYTNPFVYRSMIPFMIKRRLAEFDETYGTESVDAS